MNLKDGNGKVPVWSGGVTPWILIEWPTREEFDLLWPRSSPDNVDRHWFMLMARSRGSTLSEIGGKFNVTKERVRQIEARFQRLMRQSLKV